MPIPALIMGAAALGSAYLARRGQQEANVQNVDLAREQMAFQERMSSSAYQRSMQDMKAAGLNPMLAYQQGGATSPPGARATVESEMEPAVDSARSSMRMVSELKSMKSSRELMYNQSLQARNAATREAADSQVKYKQQDLQELQARILKLQIPALENSAKVEQGAVGKNAAFIERLRQALMGGRGFFNPIGG